MNAHPTRFVQRHHGWPKVSLALAALLAALALPSLAADPPKCNLVRIAEWPVRLLRGLPIVDGAINGKKVGVLLDTGSYASVITKATAEKLDLITRGTPEVTAGIGGVSRVLVTRIEELRVADAVVTKGLKVRVAGERPIPGIDLILGQDVFRKVDVEFDYANGVVRLFTPLNCKGVSLAYWDPNALQVPMEDETNIFVPLKVNGRVGRAMIDSGASSSMVSLYFAGRVGITPDTPGVVPSSCAYGVGADIMHSWVARFDTVALAEETIRDPRLKVADYATDMANVRGGAPDVILGTDFLRAHRMLVSRSQDKVYFSYTGGLIFPATPALDCDDRVKGKGVKEALAAYEQAIAENPKDTKALVNRAVLLLGQKDAQGALSDLDAAIRIEPNNAVALGARAGVRAGVRASLKDYDGALADSDAAIANGMHTAPMYVTRAGLRRSQGDYVRANEELDQALKLDPHDQAALRTQGQYLFQAGRFEAAEKDFATLLAIRPNGIDAIWLSLARARRGLDGHAVLEQGIAKVKDGEWPAPIMQYMLGRLDREALIAAAGADEKQRKGQECEARFYMAEHFIVAGRKSDARPLLEAARDQCPRNYIEHESALAELANLQ
jgi:tetratricopeptide (TPR) repeat protein/predicted aspartyl protease